MFGTVQKRACLFLKSACGLFQSTMREFLCACVCVCVCMRGGFRTNAASKEGVGKRAWDSVTQSAVNSVRTHVVVDLFCFFIRLKYTADSAYRPRNIYRYTENNSYRFYDTTVIKELWIVKYLDV